MASKAKFKLVHNKPQLICSECNKIIKYDKQFTDLDWRAYHKEVKMEAQLCSECEEEIKYK